MASPTVQAQGGLTVSTANGTQVLNRAVSYTPTGGKYFSATEIAGTAAAALSVADLASLRYVGMVNPSDSAATVTVTLAAIILKPGDVAVFPTYSTSVTHQATAAAVELQTAGTEV